MAVDGETIHVAIEGRLATLTLDRPPLNIFDLGMLAELDRAFERIAEHSELQLVVVRSAQKVFSAGVAVEIHVPEHIPAMLETFHGALRKLWRLEPLTLAAVHGHCLGGGMELALCCDLVLAEASARFGQPEIHVGCYPPVAAALLPRRIGMGNALDLMVTGRAIDASEAERLGIVQRVVPEGDLASGLAAFNQEILQGSAVAQKLAKRAGRASLGQDFFEGALQASERLYLEDMARAADVEEGARAFLEKRPPVWQHR